MGMAVRLTVALGLALGTWLATPSAALAQGAEREITRIAGEVYRFKNKFHYTVFAVTPDGIIATDPINADAAKWLNAELEKRFGVPVRYLVYSHDHRDHIAGGEAFADSAVVIAHERAKQAIIGEKRPTRVPDVTFRDQLTIELGGTVVELSYVGRNHSDNSIVMRFPKERILFAVDFIPVNSVGFRDFPDAYLADWIDSLKRVEAMDFDTLVPGHGGLGTKDDVAKYRVYMEMLRDSVLAGARAGKSLDELKQSIKLEPFKDWFGYDNWFQLNIEGMYRMVQANRRGN